MRLVRGILVWGGATPLSGAARETKIPGVPWLCRRVVRVIGEGLLPGRAVTLGLSAADLVIHTAIFQLRVVMRLRPAGPFRARVNIADRHYSRIHDYAARRPGQSLAADVAAGQRFS